MNGCPSLVLQGLAAANGLSYRLACRVEAGANAQSNH